MSLEDRIADLQEQAGLLLDLPQQIADAATQQIDRIGDAYENHIDRLTLTFYVSNTGDDTQSGLTNATPLATIKKAIDLTPVGGASLIRIMNATHIDDGILVNGKSINIISDSSERHSITFEHSEFQSNGNSFSRVEAFELANRGQISFRTLTLSLPHSDGNFANNRYEIITSIIQAAPSNIALGALTSAAIIDCNIDRPANSLITIASTSNGALVLATRSIIETDQPLSGYWVHDVAAGTDPTTLSNVLTNLPSL